MSDITLKWGDGEYLFALKGRQIDELQRLCGGREPVGIGAIANRVFMRQFFWADIVHTIRLALIGGGMDAVRAKELTDTYVEGQTLANPNDPSSPVATARAILEALFVGIEAAEDREPGEGGAGGTASSISPA